jgi:hypothetical protein
MCARHGLPYEQARQLVPLVQRALEAPDAVRDRILTLVESNLARRVHGQESPERLTQDLDQEVLISVARILHVWSPSDKVMDMGGMLPRLFPDSFGAVGELGGDEGAEDGGAAPGA